MPSSRPLTLDETLAVPDDPGRLALISTYLERLESQAAKARAARADTVRSLREQGVTWRALAEISGLSEQYLRALVKP